MHKLLIGLLLISSVSAFAGSLEECAYEATTRALESDNAGLLSKDLLELKILNTIEVDCLMREKTTIQRQSHNPFLAKGIKNAIADFKKTHRPQDDIRNIISDLL